MGKAKRVGSGAWPLLSMVLGGGLLYFLFIRPWHLHWGATELEARWPLPGDERVPNPKLNATHAVTINAPAERVWPWLLQMGQDRGGFYSYELVENLIGADIRNADRLRPEWLDRKVGDKVRLAANDSGVTVAVLEPDRDYVLLGQSWPAGDASRPPTSIADYFATVWGWHLAPIDDRSCRLIERWRSDWNRGLRMSLLMRLLIEPGAFLMERKNLLGIKERAERT